MFGGGWDTQKTSCIKINLRSSNQNYTACVATTTLEVNLPALELREGYPSIPLESGMLMEGSLVRLNVDRWRKVLVSILGGLTDGILGVHVDLDAHNVGSRVSYVRRIYTGGTRSNG
jgi:hypothetical protein